MPAEGRVLTERERVEDWRESVLISAGYPPDAAIGLARDQAIDLHRAVALLTAGCPVDLALRIIV